MKKIYHLFVTSYKLRVKLPRFCEAKSPLKNLKGINCSGVARNALTSYLKPLTAYLIPLTFFLLLPFAVVAQCPFNNLPLETNPDLKAYYGYQKVYSDDPMDYASKPNAYSSTPSQTDPFIPRYDAPFLYEGIVPNRHKLITASDEYDKIIPALKTKPDDATWSIKLGNDQIYYECEAIVYEFTPDIMNPILLLDFAVVFEDPEHTFQNQPRFILRITDDSGNLLEQCTEYDVTSAANLSGFNTWQPQGDYQGEERWHNTTVYWRDWTKMSVDLSKFVGHPIQVQIINYDCGEGGHFGYCYFTAKCIPNTLKPVLPCTSTSFTLEAPEGFYSYLWSSGQTTDTATFGVDTIMNSNITCKVISDMGCECTLYAYVTNNDTLTQYVTYYPDVICEGQTYTKHNFNLPPQDTGIHHYQLAIINLYDCEVYVNNLELEVIPRYTYFRDSICAPDPFLYHNQWSNIPEFPTPGVWRDSVYTITISDCDLYDVMELVVSVDLTTLTIQGDLSPCTEELVTYSFLGSEALTYFYWELPDNAVPVSGVYRPQLTLYFTDNEPCEIILHIFNGCGSETPSLHITPRQSYNTQIPAQICQGEVYSDDDFNLGVQNEVGFFVHSKHLQSVHGCDSTVTLGLNVLPIHTVHIEPIDTAICNSGDEITLWALIGEEEYPAANDCSPYPFVFIYNCGYSYSWSATPPDISITPADTTGGITVTPNTTTTYTVTVTSDIGCSATATQIVVVGDVSNPVSIKDTICFGETYSAYGINVSPAVAGTTTHTGSITASGCTVPINLTLTMLDEAKFIIKDTICSGDTYDDHGFHFDLYGDGLYIDTVHFISHRGCDSLVIFNFTINPQKETFINDNICQYDTYNKNGFDTVQNFAGLQILTKTFETSEGCDSTVVVRLNVYPSPVNVVDFGIAPGYPGITNTFTNWSIYYDESGIAVWEWYLNGTLFATTKDASYIFAEEGDYTVTLKVKSINGCWDEVTKIVTIDPCPTPTIIVDDPEVEVCGLETVTITGSFSDADKITAQILNSFGRKARITVDNNTNTFTVTYSPTIANVGNVIEIVLTATDSSTTCSGTTESIFITVKPKPKVRFKGECAE